MPDILCSARTSECLGDSPEEHGNLSATNWRKRKIKQEKKKRCRRKGKSVIIAPEAKGI